MTPHNAQPTPALAAPVPARAGIGLKAQHYQEIAETKPDLAFLEIHPENYMSEGGPNRRWLERLREMYPVSMHGVGLSLGSAGPLNKAHLQRWTRLERELAPALASEHLSWSTHEGDYLNDLLPLPYTEESLRIFCEHVEEMQETLKRTVLIENPSAYMRYAHSPIPEIEFLNAVVARTGCDLLLDVNNVFGSASNLGFDPIAYLDAVPGEAVKEIHLAGHAERRFGNEVLRIDDHGSKVCADVWTLYTFLIERIGARPTLIEWDTDVPELSVLLGEAAKANAILSAFDCVDEERCHAAAC